MQQINAKICVSADWWGKVASCQCLLQSAGRTLHISQGDIMDLKLTLRGVGYYMSYHAFKEQLQAAFTEFKTQDLCRCFKTSQNHPTLCIKCQRNYFEGTSLQQTINTVTTIRKKYCPKIISPRYIGTAFCNTLRGYGPVTRQTVQQMNHRFWSCILYISTWHQLL